MTRHLSRRSLLAGTAATAVGAATVGLVGCGPTGSTPDEQSGPAGNVAMPTYTDPVTAEPDLVSAHQGMSAFFQYPTDPTASVPEPPLNGETVSALTYTYDPLAPGMDQNPMWQAINEAMGGTLDISWVQSGEYASKLATTIAGGDLPDFVSVVGDGPAWPAQFPALLRAQFTDLSEFLAGDAINDYPNLAGIPTRSWQRNVIDGRLWGVPIPRVPIGAPGLLREDIVTAEGLSMAPQSKDELFALLKGLTSPDNKRFGSADPGAIASFLAASLGVASGWTEQAGAFVHEMEDERYAQALADVAELWQAGVFHPESIAATNNMRNDWFTYGTVPLVFGGFAGWSKYEAWGEPVDGFTMAPLQMFAYDGSAEPVHRGGSVQASTTLIKKSDPERVRFLLRTLNWLAAPFGSSEHLLKAYGVEGETYTLDGSDPILTESGATLRLVPFAYVGDAPQMIYDPGKQRVSQARFDYQEAALAMVPPDPTLGLYSETSTAKSSQLLRQLNDVRASVLTGRDPVSAWQSAVEKWRSDGGDAIRGEYEEAFAKQ
ncbi:extracellular solute-binding protein [Propionibacteriaceae bacterium Y2011]|uniref:extracellular solute-binding protein n=1 Tax=Microlunatus sp. Y2014 TaxID=3418488 RepID=UPI003B4E3207